MEQPWFLVYWWVRELAGAEGGAGEDSKKDCSMRVVGCVRFNQSINQRKGVCGKEVDLVNSNEYRRDVYM